MKLTPSDAELFIGGTDPSQYTGDIEYHELSSDEGYWQIGSGTATVEGKVVATGMETIIDSGTSLMYAPAAAVEEFYKAIPGSQEYDTVNGLWSYPCDSAPSITLSWGGQQWSISE